VESLVGSGGATSSPVGAPLLIMDPEAVRRTLEPTASAAEITGSNPPPFNFYDPVVINGVSLETAEHGRVLCSFVVTPRFAVITAFPSLPNRCNPFPHFGFGTGDD
jgi:hypothetical protein